MFKILKPDKRCGRRILDISWCEHDAETYPTSNADGLLFSSEKDAREFIEIIKRSSFYHAPPDGGDVVLVECDDPRELDFEETP